MKTKLTIEQVNKNLSSLFPGKPIYCTKAGLSENRFTAYYFYIIETPKVKLAVGEDKQVYACLSQEKMNEYKRVREDCNRMYTEITVFGEIYTEWLLVDNLRRRGKNETKENIERLLIATGYKKAKQAETTEQKLRRLMGANYVNFYKIVKEVNVTGYEFKNVKKWIYGRNESFDILLVKHTTGSFSFPITELNGNNYDGSIDTEVQDIFCELLGIKNPYTLAAMEEIRVAA